jgi:DNA-binding transcriptional LysR family regulator
MEFKQLESFLAVVKTKSFSKAAEQLFLTQPAVTSNLKKLERELGAILVNRKAKEISLTKDGEHFLPLAVDLINRRDQAKNRICPASSELGGILEISASTIPEQFLLPPILRDFCLQYPNIRLSIRHMDSQQVLNSIQSGHQNMGVTGNKQKQDGLDYLDFYEDRLVLATPPDMKLSDDNHVSIHDLAGKNLILRETGSGTRKRLEDSLANQGIDLSLFGAIHVVESNETIKKMVSLGMGISFLSNISVMDEQAMNLITIYDLLDIPVDRVYSLVHTTYRCLSPEEEAFKIFVKTSKTNN